jgi:circadian clock protein KaiC
MILGAFNSYSEPWVSRTESMPAKERSDGERERCLTGIDAIDHILNGGIPRGNTVLISGSVGTGKTSICIEFLIRGALNGENSLYLSVTEPTDKLLVNVIPFDFFEDRLMKQGKLQFIDLPKMYEKLGIDKEDLDFDQTRLLADTIAETVEEQKVRRLVLDSVTSVCYRIKDQERIRDFLLRLGTELSSKGCTTLLVSEIMSSEEGYSRWGVEEAIADGVIVTGNLERRGDLLRTLQIVKMRGTTHSRAKYVLDLTTSGVLLVPLLKGGSVTGGG